MADDNKGKKKKKSGKKSKSKSKSTTSSSQPPPVKSPQPQVKKKQQNNEEQLTITPQNYLYVSDGAGLPISVPIVSRGQDPDNPDKKYVIVDPEALRLDDLFKEIDIDKSTEVRIGPETNLSNILTGRSLIPFPTEDDRRNSSRSSGRRKSRTTGPQNPVPLPTLPSNAVPAIFIRIGSWKLLPRNEGDLLLKFDYRTNMLAWEYLLPDQPVYRIETDWSNIIGIKAEIEDAKQGTIQIELQNPPTFYRGVQYKRIKNTKWVAVRDFTDDYSASRNRRHFAMFAPGMLGENYKRLIKKNKHLSQLSHKPFPTSLSPFFPTNIYDHFYDHSLYY